MKVLAIILLLGAVVAPILASTRCDDWWTLYGGKCYYFRQTAASWLAARSWCQQQGGDLARPYTSGRNTFITHLTVGFSEVWIGLSDRAREDHFHWVITDAHAEYTPWQGNNPDNRNSAGQAEDCVETRDGLWNDAACSYARRYVCEKDASACTV